jgi:hypothetical protein
MRQTGIVALAAMALVIPVMAFAQAPVGAWCAGSYGAEGTNFAPCVAAPSVAQVAGQASGIQPQMAATEPQYPAGQVTFENGQAVYNKQVLNLSYGRSRDRSAEPQAQQEHSAPLDRNRRHSYPAAHLSCGRRQSWWCSGMRRSASSSCCSAAPR